MFRAKTFRTRKNFPGSNAPALPMYFCVCPPPQKCTKVPESKGPPLSDFHTLLEGRGGGGSVGPLLGQSPSVLDGEVQSDREATVTFSQHLGNIQELAGNDNFLTHFVILEYLN